MRNSIRAALIVAIALVSGVAHAADANEYIVVLSLHGELTDAAVSAAGGVVTERFWDHVVARLTPSAIEALQSNHAVTYIQRIGETVDSSPALRPEAKTMTVVPGGKAEWAPPAWSSGAYQYDGSGNVTAIGTSTSPSSDGRTSSYGYDLDSRLTSWSATGQTTQTYAYDAFGNLTSGVTVDAATNRLTGTGISYDVAGNQVNNGTYGYDSLNMMTSKVGSANEGTSWYVYTPDDERIGVLQPAIEKWNWTLRGFDHDVLREYQSSSSTPASAWVWIEDHVYRGSGLLLAAERPPAEGGQRHFHLDHLGTPRLVTGLNGGLVALHDYAPYGAEITSPCQEENLGFDREEPHRFTVHERDFAASCADTTALDYMHARAYSAAAKRFLSVDPIGGDPSDPQSFNRYGYVIGNPVNVVDPDGRQGMNVSLTASARQSRWAEFYAGFIPYITPFGCGSCEPESSLSRATGYFLADVASGQFTAVPKEALSDVFDMRRALDTLRTFSPLHVFGPPDGSEGGPDYMSVTMGCCHILGVALQVTADKFGDLYFGVGGVVGTKGLSGAVTWGRLDIKNPNRAQVRGLLGKGSNSVSGGVFFGGTRTWSGPIRASELGLMTPNAGVARIYSWGPF